LFIFTALIITLVTIPVLFFHGKELFPIQYNLAASLSSVVLFSVIFYTLTRYKIISLQKMVNISLSYTLLTLIITLFYSTTVIHLNTTFGRFNNQLINTYIMIFFIALIIPLRNRLQKLIDIIFFGNIVKQHKALGELAKELVTHIDKQKIVSLLRKRLKEYLGTDYVAISENTEQSNAKAKLIIPINNEKIKTNILLGEKNTGLPYNESDLEMLNLVASQAAIALKNAALYQSVIDTQREVERTARLASLGTLAAGMAHEIKNPLAAINNLVKLFPLRADDKNFQEEFNKIVPRQL
jgi:C4-dicarboxylate-specific signal transduction histidine kinase